MKSCFGGYKRFGPLCIFYVTSQPRSNPKPIIYLFIMKSYISTHKIKKVIKCCFSLFSNS